MSRDPRLERFVDELLRWNERINLTAAKNRQDAMRHVSDSEAIVPFVPVEARRVIDVGSGGGLPAAIVAILRPDVEVTALEPVHKKHAFLAHVKRTLPVTNLSPLAERVEAHAGTGYDVAMSRATFALLEWLEIGSRLVRHGGVVLGMEGADQVALPVGASRHPYPLDDRARAIIVLQR